jgi:uncharacterized membrane protein YhaH (DUF805 family)
MGQYSGNRNIQTFIVGIIACVTCAVPYMILLAALHVDFDKPIFIILLFVITIVGYIIWNVVYNRVIVKK